MSTGPERVLLVTQGSFLVSADPEVVLTTILGSCIAVCLHDPVARIGGMNHFLLPGEPEAQTSSVRHGYGLTESLLGELIRQGARRERISGKLFGGGRMIAGMVNIGALNGEFAEAFLHSARIPLLSKSIGGERPRRLRFWPTCGRVQQLLIGGSAAR